MSWHARLQYKALRYRLHASARLLFCLWCFRTLRRLRSACQASPSVELHLTAGHMHRVNKIEQPMPFCHQLCLSRLEASVIYRSAALIAQSVQVPIYFGYSVPNTTPTMVCGSGDAQSHHGPSFRRPLPRSQRDSGSDALSPTTQRLKRPMCVKGLNGPQQGV